MDGFSLTAQEVASLKKLHKTQCDQRLADRIKAIVLLGTGWSNPHVAEVLLVDASTIRD